MGRQAATREGEIEGERNRDRKTGMERDGKRGREGEREVKMGEGEREREKSGRRREGEGRIGYLQLSLHVDTSFPMLSETYVCLTLQGFRIWH